MFSAYQWNAFWSGQHQIKRTVVSPVPQQVFDDEDWGGIKSTALKRIAGRRRIARDDQEIMETIIKAVIGGIL